MRATKNRIQKVVLFTLLAFFMFSCGEEKYQNNSNDDQPIQLEEITISELQEGYKNGEYTVTDVVESYIKRIQEIDQGGPELNSVIMINPDALQIAAQLDEELQKGQTRGPLHGIPVLLKDNIDTHDKMPNTAGSRALADSYPLNDSYIVAKLRESGAVILGKTNLSEWANFRGFLSSSGWSGVGGQTKNPYILDRNPCGSSSGSGVAVSANLCVVAIGTETDGSIVCPSTSNGIVGIKPTVGLLSRSGIIPISFTQDTPGPMARTVEDAAICLGTMVGVDESDSKTLSSEGNAYSDYTQFLNKEGLRGKRIGLYTEPLGTNYKVDTLVYRAVNFMKTQGAEIVEIDKISEKNVDNQSFQVLLYEFKDGLNNYLAGLDNPRINNLKELIAFNASDSVELSFFNQQILVMAEAKGDLQSDEYLSALSEMQNAIRKDGIDRVMDQYRLDAIIAPTGSPAWKTDHTNGDAYILGSSSPAAMAGYPNITVPMGLIEGLPVGISFFGKAWSEPVLIEIAFAYEQGTKYRKAPEFLGSDD